MLPRLDMKQEKQDTRTQENIFTSEVKIAGINPYVEVPLSVVNAIGGGAKAAALVKFSGTDAMNDLASNTHEKNGLVKDAERLQAIGRLAAGGWFRSTLVPSRSGPTRVYLDKWMRETVGASVGDRVQVTLKPDRSSRELKMPDALQEALNSDPKAMESWTTLSPSGQREILTYLNFLKTPAALERNVHKVIAELLAEEDLNL